MHTWTQVELQLTVAINVQLHAHLDSGRTPHYTGTHTHLDPWLKLHLTAISARDTLTISVTIFR